MTIEKISNEIFISSDTKRTEAIKRLSEVDLNTHIVKFVKVRDSRTTLQNSALHKYFSLLANKLNESGWTVKKLLLRKPEVDIPWTTERVKEILWKPTQEAMTGKKSTTEANKTNYSDVHQILDFATSQELGIHVPFPSKESMK